jgi:hypothetical protein
VDGLVFVADSMKLRREKNLISLQNAKENLIGYKKNPAKMPLVFQYNKRDLGEQGIPLLSVDTLQQDLNAKFQAPYFEASALEGTNVIETLKKIISLTMASLSKDLE